jgi:pimeloyl-ACP methyl ester carboxylesterase
LNYHGYQFNTHQVITEDGYVLELWNIPGKLGEDYSNGTHKQPVMFNHGVIDMGGTWFFNSLENSLAYQMIEEGYDVWVANNRGTTQSRFHTSLDMDSPEFWDFTFNEMGKYDVPANVDYILEHTGYEDLIYVGHSQGTAQWFIANCLYQEDIGHKFKAFIGLAPVMYVAH